MGGCISLRSVPGNEKHLIYVILSRSEPAIVVSSGLRGIQRTFGIKHLFLRTVLDAGTLAFSSISFYCFSIPVFRWKRKAWKICL